jgi:hypothetical protein
VLELRVSCSIRPLGRRAAFAKKALSKTLCKKRFAKKRFTKNAFAWKFLTKTFAKNVFSQGVDFRRRLECRANGEKSF